MRLFRHLQSRRTPRLLLLLEGCDRLLLLTLPSDHHRLLCLLGTLALVQHLQRSILSRKAFLRRHLYAVLTSNT